MDLAGSWQSMQVALSPRLRTRMVRGLLVCVSVLLIARVPWMQRAIGPDRLVGWHTVLGAASLSAERLVVGTALALDDRATSALVEH